MDNIAQLEATARKANNALGLAQEKAREQENRALVGRYFKYRNNYSCPKKPSDYWWLYARVTKLRGSHIHMFEFQTDRYGKVEIEQDRKLYNVLTSGYVEINASEFNKAWLGLQKRVANWRLISTRSATGHR